MGFDFFKSHLFHDEKTYKKSLLEKERLERNLYKATTWDVFMYIERGVFGIWGAEMHKATSLIFNKISMRDYMDLFIQLIL